MRLVLDTSALRRIEVHGPARLLAAFQGADEVWVPASALFELERQRGALLTRLLPGATAPQHPVEWLRQAWEQRRVGGGVLAFTESTALALAGWLHAPGRGPDWYAWGKLWKAFVDAKPLVNKALDGTPAVADKPLPVLKEQLHRAAEGLQGQWPGRVPRASGTIDWLHLGHAVELDACLVAADTGWEFEPSLTLKVEELYAQLGVSPEAS